jgi:undecaprenyl-diphosphatase
MLPYRVAGLLLVVALIAGAASLPTVHAWDRAITVWLQQAAPAPDGPAAGLVFLGNAEVMIPAAMLVAIALLFRDPRRGRRAASVAVGLGVVSALAFGLKYLIPHPGPPLSLQRPVFLAGLGIPQPYSFPSGHTMRTTFLAGVVLRGRPFFAGALILAMMAGLVYLGDHWTSDVLGGLCLGWACVEAARSVTGRLGL